MLANYVTLLGVNEHGDITKNVVDYSEVDLKAKYVKKFCKKYIYKKNYEVKNFTLTLFLLLKALVLL